MHINNVSYRAEVLPSRHREWRAQSRPACRSGQAVGRRRRSSPRDRGSDVASRDVAIFGGDSDRAHGRDVEAEEPDPIAPLECPRCGKETPRDGDFCVWCNQALDREAIDTLQGRERELRDAVLRLVREDSSLVDDGQQAQDVMTVLDGRPDPLKDAESFRDALREERGN
jgi:hypothetical protein